MEGCFIWVLERDGKVMRMPGMKGRGPGCCE